MLDSGTEAEDAVQDAFVSAWRQLPQYRGQAAFGTRVPRVVVNRCLNVLRARRPETDLESVPEPAAPAPLASPARAAESRAAARDLAEALASLSPEQRVCSVLREVEDLPHETLAETVGIRTEVARGRVFRARRCMTEARTAWR
ncbi:RNA polymerase sigma-70 factor, ECF subfamily [Actinacidiphila rubida]|uniref:RNA polymerase sigma-70 factor, ECF subfamily n=2 Tax=Actinacidiphila rubida TaxID=310780 RepID=A0A1H8V4U1_9ACTN|nr:RNA polymerase sigma-70 factor, ECF subfamily [Actinacidiphila rubida]